MRVNLTFGFEEEGLADVDKKQYNHRCSQCWLLCPVPQQPEAAGAEVQAMAGREGLGGNGSCSVPGSPLSA